jgi:hypothetical protein
MGEHEQVTRSRMFTAFLRSEQSRNVRDSEGYVATLDCLNALRPYHGRPWSHDDIADVVRTSIRTNNTRRFHAKYSGVGVISHVRSMKKGVTAIAVGPMVATPPAAEPPAAEPPAAEPPAPVAGPPGVIIRQETCCLCLHNPPTHAFLHSAPGPPSHTASDFNLVAHVLLCNECSEVVAASHNPALPLMCYHCRTPCLGVARIL